MSRLKRYDGDVVPIVADVNLTVNLPHKIGRLFGVPVDTVLSGASDGLEIRGVQALPKVGGGGVTFALGDVVYWNESTGKATATATDDRVGVCTKAAVNADTEVYTLINGQIIDQVDADALNALFGAGSTKGRLTRTGLNTFTVVVDKLDGTTAPLVTNDSSQGYSVGSNWWDATNKKAYTCTDATVGAAVWNQTSMVAGFLSADATGRGYMAANYFDAATALAKFGAGAFNNTFVQNAFAANAFGADAPSRAAFVANFFDAATFAAKVAAGAIPIQKLQTKTLTALADADGVLSAANLVNASIFTITPTADRALTTDTAANLITQLGAGAGVGTWFEFTVVNAAAATASHIVAGAGVTLVGAASMATIAASSSASYIGEMTGAGAVSLYRR